MGSTSAPAVYPHDISTSDTIYDLLKSHLPNTLTILRRIEYPKRTPATQLLATFPPSTTPRADEPFAVCYFGPSEPRAVDGWLFSSLEQHHQPRSSNTEPNGGDASTQHDASAHVAHIIAILQHIRHTWTPPDTPPISNTHPDAPGQHSGTTILLGAVHERTAAALRAYQSPKGRQDESIVRDDVFGKGGPYRKYVFPSTPLVQEQTAGDENDLPRGLVWSKPQARDYALIQANNALVRSAAVLRLMPGCAGARDEATGVLAAWAFRHADASVRTVHCVPEWRRKGVARAVVKRLVEEDVDEARAKGLLGPAEERWQHADVAGDNEGSVRLFESLGASWSWESYWMRIDLDRVP